MTDVPLHRIDIAAAAQPALVVAGKLWFDTVASRLKIYNGATFDEYTINTDVDDKIDIHRAEVSAHEAVNLDVDTSACSFTSASDLQTFTDDIGVNFYDKYVMEHDYATGVHGPNVTITTTTGDSLSIVTDTTAAANAALRVITTSGGVKALYIDSSISAESVNVLHNKSAYASPTVRIASTTNGYATVITQGGAGKALYTSGAAECNISSTASADPVLAVENYGQGYGIVIDQNNTAATDDALCINNSGSGYDVKGNDGNWTVDSEGNASFRNISITVPPASAGGIMSELVYDTDWFPGPIRTSLAITHNKGSDFIMGWVRGNGNGVVGPPGDSHVADWIAPAMQSTEMEYFSATSELTSNVIRCNGNTYGGSVNDIGDIENVYIHTFNTRYFVYDRVADYDSGWTAAILNTTYTFNHGLGIYPHFIYAELAQNVDGSGWRVPVMSACALGTGPAWRGTSICKISNTQVKVHTGSTNMAYLYSWAGVSTQAVVGYLRVRCYDWAPDFDSGWKAISNVAGSRDKWEWHNFGHFPSLVNLYLADNNVEAAQTWALPSLGNFSYGFAYNTSIYHVGSNHVTIKGGATYQASFLDESGVATYPTSGYYRLMAWK